MTKPNNEDLDDLMQAIACLKSGEEARIFFEDLCTATELASMAQRFHVARMLLRHQTTQRVSTETGCSTATIARVNKCLRDGRGGYALVVDRSEGEKVRNGTE